MNHSKIAQLRLQNQRISASSFRRPEEAVQWLGAVQAQDFAGSKWALGLRMQDATEPDVDRAFNEGTILRTHLLRPTWHFVTPADIRWMLALTAPRVHAANALYYRKLELDQDIVQRSTKALVQALQGGKQLTRDELRDVLEGAGIQTRGELRMIYLLMRAELDGIICSGGRRGNQFTYALLDERAPQASLLGHEQALAELAQRYFTSRGPATVHDFAKWSGLTVTAARTGLEAVKTHLENDVVDGQTLWFSPSPADPPDEAPSAYLLSIYDEYISGYKDRSAIVSADHGARLVGMGNALSAIIVVDGQIVGTWKRMLKKDSVVIHLDLFMTLNEAENQAVLNAAQRYGKFLGKTVIGT